MKIDFINLLIIFISSSLINNFVLSYFLGLCPFLGVSSRLSNALSMGFATTFVLVCSAVITYLINTFLLIKYNLEYLQYVAFILVIASFVQMVESFIKKMSPPLYRSMGIFLPLITTNCAILGLTLFSALREYDFIENIVFGFGAGVGFTLALAIMAGIREEMEHAPIFENFKGNAITFITAGILALIFLGFSGLI